MLYTLPKQKDPVNKARLIASYTAHPLREVFKNVSKILTWLFASIKHYYGMFTLYKLNDIKLRVHQAQSLLRKAFGEDTADRYNMSIL